MSENKKNPSAVCKLGEGSQGTGNKIPATHILAKSVFDNAKAEYESAPKSRYRSPSNAVLDAEKWIEENREAWLFMVDGALDSAARKQHFNIRQLMDSVRYQHFLKPDSEIFKVDNTLAPGLARVLVREYPMTKPYITLRRAACDGMAEHD